MAEEPLAPQTPEDDPVAVRRAKLDALRGAGVEPYPNGFDFSDRARDLVERYAGLEAGAETEDVVTLAGRLVARRDQGKLAFLVMRDATGEIQLFCRVNVLGEAAFEAAKELDLGDWVGATGTVLRSRRGELSVQPSSLTLLSKSLRPLPEKYHGLSDTETRYRQRYVDLIANPEVREVFETRFRVIGAIRRYMDREGYLEVETPMLQPVPGGAAARPFVTHHNALDMPLYLRIALELHLKRLMVGGVERVYEIGRVFRNEGVDSTHNPEFTMIELYQAYGDYETMMELTEAIFVNAIQAIGGGLQRPWRHKTIDYTPPWPRRKYADLFREYAGCDLGDAAATAEAARRHGVETAGKHPDVIVNDLFEEVVEHHLAGPVFVIDYPASMCPLTKRKRGQPDVAERFELFIDGMELANAYTELNDPRLQEELFSTQLAGLSEEDSMAKMDHDFVRALKVGMPPAGGLGIGIDRLVMLLTNSHSIRDVIYFPLLRREKPAAESEEETTEV